MKITLSALTLAFLALAPAAAFAQSANNKEVGQALRAGGYVVLVRHGATFSNQADTEPFNLSDITKQRNLNDKGKELAKAFGAAIRAAGVPVGEVLHQPVQSRPRNRSTGRLPGHRDDRRSDRRWIGGYA
jgi:hypothetical protein